MKEASAYILNEVQEALDKVDQTKVSEVIDMILSAKKIFVYGVGRSGLVGKSFAVRLVQLGMDVHFVGDMTTPIVEQGDLVILISNTGETMSAVQTANIVGRIGSKIVSVTSSVHSKLGSISDVVLEITPEQGRAEEEAGPAGDDLRGLHLHPPGFTGPGAHAAPVPDRIVNEKATRYLGLSPCLSGYLSSRLRTLSP